MYKVGTRIKKVRGDYNIGLTGLVIEGWIHPINIDDGCDIVVQPDTISMDGWSGNMDMSAGAAKSKEWEPIIPDGSDVPAEVSFHELLDPSFYGQAEPLHATA